jgi:hypothetical protein
MVDTAPNVGPDGSLYAEASYMSGLVPTDATGTGALISPASAPIFTLSPSTQSLATLVNSTFGTSTAQPTTPLTSLSSPLIWLIGGGIVLLAILASNSD